MSKENPIGLAELIEKVKRELITTEPDVEDDVPLLSLDEIHLELKVSLHREGKAGLNIHVVELGAGVDRDDIQTVKVTLSPLMTKEERIRLFKMNYPERWEALEKASIEGGLKGEGEVSSDDLF